ncbi:MAG: hypothetical protein ACR2GL_02340 [Thermoleophilaceae bacterium]
MPALVRLAAVLASVFVALGFLLFAVDQSEESSARQVGIVEGDDSRPVSETAIDRPAPSAPVERMRERRHGGARELIDDVNDVLLAPFTGLIASRDAWVERIVPGALALLLYGLGGMLLANFLPQSRRKHSDWRQATG